MSIPLKKFKKTQLIRLVKEYENDIVDLQDRLAVAELGNERIVKEYIIVDETNDKTIQYIQSRIRVINDKHKKAIYVRELQRLLPEKSK